MHLNIPLIIFIYISDANALAQLTILYSPNSIQFKGNQILEENLKDIYLASLGMTNTKSSQFREMKVIDPFDLPEAIVEVYVEGIPAIGDLSDDFSHNYKLTTTKYLPQTFSTLKSRITKLLGIDKPNIVNIDFSSNLQLNENIKIFDLVKPRKPTTSHLQYLKYNQERDYIFLSELEYIKAIVAKVNSGKIHPNGYMDYYKIKIRKIHDLSEAYGKKSLQVKEAKRLLVNVLRDLKEAFVNAYKGSVLITIIATDEIRGRKPRYNFDPEDYDFTIPDHWAPYIEQTSPATTKTTKKEIPSTTSGPSIIRPPGLMDKPGAPGISLTPVSGLTPDSGTEIAETNTEAGSGGDSYVEGVDEDDPDFPLRFNLIFWFILMYTYALIATIYFVMRINPDKDCLIYRMSNIRAKKEH